MRQQTHDSRLDTAHRELEAYDTHRHRSSGHPSREDIPAADISAEYIPSR